MFVLFLFGGLGLIRSASNIGSRQISDHASLRIIPPSKQKGGGGDEQPRRPRQASLLRETALVSSMTTTTSKVKSTPVQSLLRVSRSRPRCNNIFFFLTHAHTVHNTRARAHRAQELVPSSSGSATDYSMYNNNLRKRPERRQKKKT